MTLSSPSQNRKMLSVGIVTHGVVAVGIFSFGFVSMGLLSSGIVTTGLNAHRIEVEQPQPQLNDVPH